MTLATIGIALAAGAGGAAAAWLAARLRDTPARKTQQRWQHWCALLDSLPLLAGIKDRTGRYVFVNRAMAAWFCARGVEIAGRRDAEVLVPAIAAFVRESEEKLLRGEETLVETEVDQAEWLPGAGEGRWLLHKVALRGAPCGDSILMVAQEITELHRAQIELARQRDFAQAVHHSSPALIIVLDAAGRLVRWNRECERATGYHESECRGQPFADLLGTPQSRPDLLKAFSRVLSGEAVAGEPAEILARGGRRLLLDISGGVVRDERGDPEWVVLTAIDRTVEKLAEARRKELALELEAIWNSSLDGLAFLDAEGRIAAANPAFCRLAGIPAEDVQNAFVTSVMAEWPGFESAELERFRDCFRRRAFEPFSTREVRLRDGRKVWLELASSFVPRTGAEPLLLISARDITSRIRSEQELRSANEFLQSTALWARELAVKAESASAAKTEFLAHVSHELRTPINAILGLLELTLQSSPPAQRDSLEMARESAESLLGLVDDLLDVAKAESGRLSVNPAPVGLRHVLNGVMRLMVHRGAAKGLQVRWRVAADVPDAVIADGARLRQVIANLVGNAIKYTCQGAVELHVDRIGPPASPRLCFVVQDSGCGIPPEHWQEIFEPFVRFHKDAAGGTGLGLTISTSLVELMGGRLYVSSQPGSGALFGFSIPLQEAVLEAGSQPAVPAAPEKATAGHAARILVAEDNPLNQQVIRGLLEKNGFSVTVVSDGAAAVEQSLSGRFDLVLMDVQMPGLDGWQAARTIRDREPQNRRVPILAMTARALEEDAAACRAAGMDGYLAKPIRMAEVLAAIAEHLPIPFSSFPAADPSAAQPDLTPERLESQVKYLDLEQALDRLGGDRALLSELAGLFCDEGPRLLQQAAEGLAAGDPTAVQNAAHQLKGLLAQFAAAEAREAAWQLELEARRADLIAAAPKLQALRERLSEVLPELRSLSENP